MADQKKRTTLSVLFGTNVKRYRTARGWTQMELAIELEMEPSYVSRIENGWANITLETIEDIAAALSVDASDLFVKPK